MSRGRLIVLEGLDGSGKTTQLALLCDALQKEGVPFRKLEFPCYESESSALVRLYLGGAFGEKPEDVNAFAASSFYAVDRYASYRSDWGKAYEAGQLMISGRYTTSNAIHQGAKLEGEARRRYMDWLFDYEYRLLGLPAPDAVFFLDVPADVAAENIARRNEARDIHEQNVRYLERCRESALEAAARYGWEIIACTSNGMMRDPAGIAEELREKITRVRTC